MKNLIIVYLRLRPVSGQILCLMVLWASLAAFGSAKSCDLFCSRSYKFDVDVGVFCVKLDCGICDWAEDFGSCFCGSENGKVKVTLRGKE